MTHGRGISKQPANWSQIDSARSWLDIVPVGGYLPFKVQQVVAERISKRLPPAVSLLLQAAAVAGARVSRDELAALEVLDDEALDDAVRIAIQAQHLIEVEPDETGRRIFQFGHPVTQEVAYSLLSVSDRQRFHRRLAEVLPRIAEGQESELAGDIARHWERAGELLEAARWFRVSADWHGPRAMATTMAQWNKVLEITRALPDTEEAIELEFAARSGLFTYGWRFGHDVEDPDRLFEEGLRRAADLGNKRALCLLYHANAGRQGLQGFIPNYVADQRRAIELAEELGDIALEVSVKADHTYALFCHGDLRRSQELCAEVERLAKDDIRLGSDLNGYSPLLYALIQYQGNEAYFGRCHDAYKALEPLAERAVRSGELEIEAWAREFQARAAWLDEDTDHALEAAQSAVEVTDRIGAAYNRVEAHIVLAEALQLSGDPESAIRVAQVAQELAQTRDVGLEMKAELLATLAWSYLDFGDWDTAHETAKQAVDVALAQEARLWVCYARYVYAHVLARAPDATGLRQGVGPLLRRADDLVAFTGANGFGEKLRRHVRR